MSELDPAHVEAVARLLIGRNCEHEAATQQDGFYGDCHPCAAEAILTSTDPDVHAALLAALVRAGILEEQVRVHYEIAAEVDGQRAFQHHSDDPRYLRDQMTRHPRRYRPGSRVMQGTTRWLTTAGATEWEDVDA